MEEKMEKEIIIFKDIIEDILKVLNVKKVSKKQIKELDNILIAFEEMILETSRDSYNNYWW